MSRFRINRNGFIRHSAGAATLGLAACSGGAAVGGSPVSSANGPAVTSPTATPVAGASATPIAASSAPSATPTPAAFPASNVSSGTRGPNSLPNSSQPAGTANTALPFEHVVVVMMENHSFDNYFGMLPLRGQPLADGFTFDKNGKPTNKNPLEGGYQYAFHLQGTCAPYGVSQDWDNTHKQVNQGAMDGFAATCNEAMGYWDEPDLPFYYSLAKTFCLGNRSFCSTQGQTYPNRRYLYAATSDGNIATSTASFSMAAPANGTLMDMMTKYGVTWMDYFTDVPALAIIPQNVENHPTNFAQMTQFYTDCAAGLLPQVSFVDPGFDLVGTVGEDLFTGLQSIPDLPPVLQTALANYKENAASLGSSEENPQDIAIGEGFAARVINAVMSGPLWSKTLLIWTYDEHGGYYDHVPPLGAPEPDGIAPEISATDYQAAFNVTGVRVPTVVVSPYSRPNSVSNVPHDHTSIIATIAAKWNLPALTYRDAQANTLLDYLNLNAPPAFLTPPVLATPAQPEDVSGGTCVSNPPAPVISPNVKQTRSTHMALRSDV